jgi:hypothetical protein
VERPLSPVPLARVGGGSRRLAILVALATVLVAAAVVKPWAGPAQSLPELATSARVAAPGLSAAASPGPLRGVDGATPGRPCCRTGPEAGLVTAPEAGLVQEDGMPICYTPDGWRVVADTEENGARSRIWLPVDAVAAGRPGDPGVPMARLTATRIVALGFCAPAGGPREVARTAILWSDLPAAAAGGRYVPVATLRSAAHADGALADAAPGRAAWPPGRYVVQVLDGARGAGSAWFGLVLTAPAS